MDIGKVWLVGAGPSDINLLTIKGKSVIENCDVLVYDRLVSHSIIQLKPDDAILIDVGKISGNHTMNQNDINDVLVKYAKKGKKVVRLKGGDPFLFGRGGEEVDVLEQNNILYEVVSGVTSAIAVPSYSGIPVTHRDFTSSIHIITGHSKNGKLLNINFDSLVKVNGTLIFLMGVSSLFGICDGLIKSGMDKNVPVCIIEKGTTSKERVIYANLYNICQKADEQSVQMPAIIMVGKVCSLFGKFDWRSKLPLSKSRVLVTRPKNLNSILCEKLRENGAEVIEIPSIKIVDYQNDDIKNTFDNIKNYNYISFTSVNGVDIFFKNMQIHKKDIRELYNTKIAIIGEATKKAVEQKGIFVDIIPDKYCGKHLAYEIQKYIKNDDNLLIVGAKNKDEDFINNLYVDNVKQLEIYETVYENFELINFKFEYTDIVVFTSVSTVKGFIKAMEKYNLDYKKIQAICIGEKTQNYANIHNMQTYVSEKATINSLVDKIIQCERSKNDK